MCKLEFIPGPLGSRAYSRVIDSADVHVRFMRHDFYYTLYKYLLVTLYYELSCIFLPFLFGKSFTTVQVRIHPSHALPGTRTKSIPITVH